MEIVHVLYIKNFWQFAPFRNAFLTPEGTILRRNIEIISTTTFYHLLLDVWNLWATNR